MATLEVEVSKKTAEVFKWKKNIKINDILDYEDTLKYNFSDEKVNLKEISDFLWHTIKSKKETLC
jgi:hypothetical protein